MTQATDHQGFLLNVDDWDTDWAMQTAQALALELTQQDLDIVTTLREFYKTFDLSPPMRPLVKLIKTNYGSDIGNSIWLMQRYGESPARILAQIAGLPKPKNCL